MKIHISTSASGLRLSARLLEQTLTHTFRAGAQRVSTIKGQEISWNYIGRSAEGKAIVVTNKNDAVGIACKDKYYSF